METCRVCGKEITNKRWCIPICSDECFTKDYWNYRVARVNEETQIVIDGMMYQIEREDAMGARGFYGAAHYIKLQNGKIIKTTNLWSNGPIPDQYREKLPDNAIWSNYKEYEAYAKQHS